MAIKRAQVTGLSGLASWLSENAAALFGSVTYANNKITATDKDGNTAFEFIYNNNYPIIRAYSSASSYVDSDYVIGANNSTFNLIMCDNGVIIDFAYNFNGNCKGGILIAKTNNDKLAFVFSRGGSGVTTDYAYKQLKHVALGDSTTMSTTTTFTPESGQQTNFCTFCTNADIMDVSYTPKAFYLPMHSAYNSGIGKFLSGGKVYITNGYWAIDTEQSEDE